MNIREVRDRTGLSQSKFAKKMGIPVSSLRKWEICGSTPPKYVVAMANKLISLENKVEKQEKTIKNLKRRLLED